MTEDQINALHRRAMTAPHPAWPGGKAWLRDVIQLEGAQLETALDAERSAAIERARDRGGDEAAGACAAHTCDAPALAAWIAAERDAIVNPLEQQQAQAAALDVRLEAVESDLAAVKADLGIL